MNLNHVSIGDFLRHAEKKAWKLRAIVKDVAGREMLCGFEYAVKKRSPKYTHKWLCRPVDLSALPHRNRKEDNVPSTT